MARNWQTVSNEHAARLSVLEHGEASSERLPAQCRILRPHLHGLEALDLHELGREAHQLGLWRRRTVAPRGRVKFLEQQQHRKLREEKRIKEFVMLWLTILVKRANSHSFTPLIND